jgi:hypothetical protein
MSKVLTAKNGLALDAQRMFTISDRTHASQVSYHMERFIGSIDYNSKTKNERIERLDNENYEMFVASQEKGVDIDNDRMLQNDRDIAWLKDQLEINEILRAYILQASQQLFPEQHKKSEDTAKAADRLLDSYAKRYADNKSAS